MIKQVARAGSGKDQFIDNMEEIYERVIESLEYALNPFPFVEFESISAHKMGTKIYEKTINKIKMNN